jgi:hypothetical protein
MNRNALLCGIGRRVPRIYTRKGKLIAYDDRLSGYTLKELDRKKERA